MNRSLIGLGGVPIPGGALWPRARGIALFLLPGDVVIDRPRFRFLFPVTTVLIVSAVLSLLAWLMRR